MNCVDSNSSGNTEGTDVCQCSDSRECELMSVSIIGGQQSYPHQLTSSFCPSQTHHLSVASSCANKDVFVCYRRDFMLET